MTRNPAANQNRQAAARRIDGLRGEAGYAAVGSSYIIARRHLALGIKRILSAIVAVVAAAMRQAQCPA